MKRMDLNKHVLSFFGPSTMLMLLAGCSIENMSSEADDMDGPPQIVALDEGSVNATRALNSQLQSFSLYVVDEYYDEDGAIAEDDLLSKVDESWVSEDPFYLSIESQNAYGVAPSTRLEGVEEVDINYDTQTFDYTVPQTNQSALKIASRLNFTRKSVGNKLMLTFRDALFSLNIQAVNEIKDVKIFIKEIKLHNVLSKGTFTFNKKKDSRGDWEPIDESYVSYEQTKADAVELSRTVYRNAVDSAFTLLPQDLDPWYPDDIYDEDEGGESFTVAKANKRLYIEVKCQITQEKDGQTLYLWGYAPGNEEGKPEYESVYFPYDEEACLSDWLMGVNSVYFLEFNTLTGGYAENGEHITPHPTGGRGSSAFENAEPVKYKIGTGDEGNVDSWTTPDSSEDITIEMDGKN